MRSMSILEGMLEIFATTVQAELNATLHVCESGIFLGIVPKESPCTKIFVECAPAESLYQNRIQNFQLALRRIEICSANHWHGSPQLRAPLRTPYSYQLLKSNAGSRQVRMHKFGLGNYVTPEYQWTKRKPTEARGFNFVAVRHTIVGTAATASGPKGRTETMTMLCTVHS
jgi:hypothetical protein